jgi:hypothetical protein
MFPGNAFPAPPVRLNGSALFGMPRWGNAHPSASIEPRAAVLSEHANPSRTSHRRLGSWCRPEEALSSSEQEPAPTLSEHDNFVRFKKAAGGQLCTLLSGETRQEPTKLPCSSPSGALFGSIVAAPQSHGQWLVIATNLPAPLPRIGVRLLHDNMIFGERRTMACIVHGSAVARVSSSPSRPGTGLGVGPDLGCAGVGDFPAICRAADHRARAMHPWPA